MSVFCCTHLSVSITCWLIISIFVFSAQFPGYQAKAQTSSDQNFKPRGQLHDRIKVLLQQNATGNINPTAKDVDPNTLSIVFKQKFSSEMTFLFSHLSRKQQCSILKKIARKVSCSVSITIRSLSSFTELWNGTRCRDTLASHTCSVDYRLRVKMHKIYFGQLGKLFLSLPLPFKCLILYSSASVPNYDTSRKQHGRINTTFTLRQAEQETEKLFKTVKLNAECSEVPSKIATLPMPAALVNLTVQLLNMTKSQWLKRFKKESAQIFFEYMEKRVKTHISNVNRPVPIFPVDKRRGSLTRFKKGNIRTAVRKVSDDRKGKFTLLFGIKVRSPSGEYKDWGNGNDIARSLRSLQERNLLNKHLKARIVKIRKLKKKKNPRNTKTLSVVLLPKDIEDANALFPTYLKNYYKEIKKQHKCYVMYIIARTLNRTVTVVEHLYSTFKLVSKKNFCFRIHRRKLNQTNVLDPPKDIQHLKANTTPGLPFPIFPISREGEETVAVMTTPRSSVEKARAKTKEEITALEIALFAMLAFLCIAIVAFTINCIIFALKTRTYTNSRVNVSNATNNTVFSKAVFAKFSRNERNNENQGNFAQSQRTSSDMVMCCFKRTIDSTTTANHQLTQQCPSNKVLQRTDNQKQMQMTAQQVENCKQEQTSHSRTIHLQEVKRDIEQHQVNCDDEITKHVDSYCTTV